MQGLRMSILVAVWSDVGNLQQVLVSMLLNSFLSLLTEIKFVVS